MSWTQKNLSTQKNKIKNAPIEKTLFTIKKNFNFK